MTARDFAEWRRLSKARDLEPHDYRELVRLNHQVMEIAHAIHNADMMRDR